MKNLPDKNHISKVVRIFLITTFLVMSTIVVNADTDNLKGMPSALDVLTEGFEGGSIPDGWLNIDYDDDSYDWDLVSPPGMPSHSGFYSAASASFINGVGPLTPDNWLIMRALTVSATSELTYWVAAQEPSWSQEHLEVWISTSGRAIPDDFTDEVDSFALTAGSSDWSERTVDLSPYDGENIYIAFRHTDVTNMFWIKIDDITVTDVTIPPIPDPDLNCEGDLSWTEVVPNSTVTGNFIVENIGDSYSLLEWEISEYPDWGTWTFTPSNGDGLTPENGALTVEVEVTVPEEKQDFTGELKVVNKNDPDDYCIIDVTLSTPVNHHFIYLRFIHFLERLVHHFPILELIFPYC